MSESTDQDGDLSHHIELITAQGVVPLTPLYYAGTGSYQREAAVKINALVESNAPGTLIVTEHVFAGLPTQRP